MSKTDNSILQEDCDWISPENEMLIFGRRTAQRKNKLSGRLPAGAVPGRFRATVWNGWGLEGDIDR